MSARARRWLAVLALLVPLTPASLAVAGGTCSNCGNVVSIEWSEGSATNARPPGYLDSPQYRESRAQQADPQYGAAMRFSFGAGGNGEATLSTQAPRSRERGSVYEITLRLDAGGYARIQQGQLYDLHTGDRARLINGRIEPED